MNKEGVYRVLESALKQYAKETGIIITDIKVDHQFFGRTIGDEGELRLQIQTTEHQLEPR